MEDRLLLAPNRHIKPLERYCKGVHTMYEPKEFVVRSTGKRVIDDSLVPLHREIRQLTKRRGIPYTMHRSFPLTKLSAYSEEVKELLGEEHE